jgi:hypothetical protein
LHYLNFFKLKIKKNMCFVNLMLLKKDLISYGMDFGTITNKSINVNVKNSHNEISTNTSSNSKEGFS